MRTTILVSSLLLGATVGACGDDGGAAGGEGGIREGSQGGDGSVDCQDGNCAAEPAAGSGGTDEKGSGGDDGEGSGGATTGSGGSGGSGDGGSSLGGLGGMGTNLEELMMDAWLGTTHLNPEHPAFTQFDGESEVPADCATCHSHDGFDYFVEHGHETTEPTAPSETFTCTTCHDQVEIGVVTLDVVDKVEFPSGVTVTNADSESGFLCIKCHAGRASTASVDSVIDSGTLTAVSVHNAPAAATWFGGTTSSGYQYAGKLYAGARVHTGGSSCITCHNVAARPHTFAARVAYSCTDCHAEAIAGVTSSIRQTTLDIDGDGDVSETLAAELDSLEAALLEEIRVRAASAGPSIIYVSTEEPFWFIDTDADGVADANEVAVDNGYTAWSAALVRAAYNYEFSQREPGAWAHNVGYMAQLLIDSIDDLGGDVSDFNRPAP